MKYAAIPLLLIVSIYPFSYAKYNWNKKNRPGAVGAVLIGISAVVYPSVLIFTR